MDQNLERTFSGLGARYRGQSLATIKPAFRRTWKDSTGDDDITEPELAIDAEAIRDGRRTDIRFDGV